MASWDRTNHRLTVTPRALAKEILAELQIGSTAIIKYYEEQEYMVSESETVEDLIVRTVQARVIYGKDGDTHSQLKELRHNLKSIEWACFDEYRQDFRCVVCKNESDDGHTDDCWLEKELK